ncbi:MAG: LPXTG cell wall anchor domain-containing protein [Acidobacteriaceae bacterium]|nr:LPXTG cell wall anchor domain-containing protein [Acidobacteriota bacterium]MBV8809094.1 LPXTG cell wall anchor domain-containing protein [Acidobacteriaceae bacterium]MBV9498010.1 LPXTG cell wall anchor domain-containing protein [Acidobacteriaceae bacterium]
MRKVIALLLLGMGAGFLASAKDKGHHWGKDKDPRGHVTGHVTPEISMSSAGSALALLSGGLLVLRGRRKK